MVIRKCGIYCIGFINYTFRYYLYTNILLGIPNSLNNCYEIIYSKT